MKISKLTVLIIATGVVLLSSCNKDDELNVTGFTYRQNYVSVTTAFGDDDGNFKIEMMSETFPWKITGGSFQITAFDVTKGQDPDHRLKIGNFQKMGNKQQFLFEFGRHGDSEVAKTFNKLCTPAHNTFNHTADKLNFWVKGTLTLTFRNKKTYTFPNTYFAQGHSGLTNNWWFGNDEMVNYSKTILAWDPYSTIYHVPVYLGEDRYGFISPKEDETLLFKFKRGDGIIPNAKNIVCLVGIYHRK